MKRSRSKKNSRSPPFLCTHDVCSPLRGPKPFVAKDSRALNQHEASGSTMHPCRSGQGCETCQRVPVRKRGKAAGRDQRDGATERKEQDQLGEVGERRDRTNEAAEVRQGPSDPTECRPFQCRHEQCERCFKSKSSRSQHERLKHVHCSPESCGHCTYLTNKQAMMDRRARATELQQQALREAREAEQRQREEALQRVVETGVKALSEIRTADIEATTYEDVAVGVTLRVVEAIMNKHNPDGSSREDLVVMGWKPVLQANSQSM